MNPDDMLDLSAWRQHIDQSIRYLQDRNKQEDEYSSTITSEPFRRRAELLAMRDLLREVSTHAGISEDRFNFVFHQLFLYHLDCLFSHVSDFHKETASRMDDRTEDEIYTGEGPPQLFQ
jgi:hypothetical protein